MAHADTRAESARIRTLLEISAFNLATMEHERIRNACIPESIHEQEIRDATYRFYKAFTTQPSRFYISEGRFNIFDPYPYGGDLHNELKERSGAQVAAAMTDRNERESVKYDAVTDLIRVLATPKVHEGKTVAPGAKVEQATVKTLETQLEAGKVRTKAVEDQLRVMRVAHAAMKLLFGEEHAVDLREIDKWRYH